jgi:aspartyl protease family protein
MIKLIFFAVTVMVVGTLCVRAIDSGRPAAAPPTAKAAQPAPRSANSGPDSVTLLSGKGGHFWANARIDGRRLELLVDTGATKVGLRASDAAMLGIYPKERDYTYLVQTANGVVRAAKVRLNKVEIGDLVVYDVEALVHGGLNENLLGQSFLSRVRMTQQHGKLILEK